MQNNIKDSYVYVESKTQDQTCIGIKGGKYAGVIYKYGNVSIGEETEDGNMPFKFEFDIIDNNAIPKENFEDDFMNLLGDILVDIIEEQNAESDNRENNTN
jgi:hypothetical protein|tara:strand:- start:482 stop:784 length:303 start_codon:yes stop_codon:yes gene_type:complete